MGCTMIAGLVITRTAEADFATLEAALHASPCTMGEHHGLFSSVAVEAKDQTEMHHWHDWLLTLPGILNVDVAFVSLEQ
jgi:hypothetical protein